MEKISRTTSDRYFTLFRRMLTVVGSVLVVGGFLYVAIDFGLPISPRLGIVPLGIGLLVIWVRNQAKAVEDEKFD